MRSFVASEVMVALGRGGKAERRLRKDAGDWSLCQLALTDTRTRLSPQKQPLAPMRSSSWCVVKAGRGRLVGVDGRSGADKPEPGRAAVLSQVPITHFLRWPRRRESRHYPRSDTAGPFGSRRFMVIAKRRKTIPAAAATR